MKKNLPKYPRVLAIAPSTRGFGFALLEGLDTLVDWGVKSITGDKNAGSIAKVEEMITHYRPGVIVLEDHLAQGSRRAIRIRGLSEQMIASIRSKKVAMKLFSRQEVRRAFFPDGKGTKDSLAEILAKRFPEELGCRLPPKRRPWMTEAYQMGIFDAVALVLMMRPRKASHTAFGEGLR